MSKKFISPCSEVEQLQQTHQILEKKLARLTTAEKACGGREQNEQKVIDYLQRKLKDQRQWEAFKYAHLRPGLKLGILGFPCRPQDLTATESFAAQMEPDLAKYPSG